MTFLERSLVDEAFVPARNTGIRLNNANSSESLTWAVGGFRTDSDIYGDSVGDDGGRSLTTRLTWLPWYDDANDGRTLVHLGGAYSYRDPNDAQVQFRTRPEARLGAATPNVPNFVDTGIIDADHWQLFGLEAAWVAGPLSLQAEQVFTNVSQPSDDLGFRAWYVTTSYFLTGEHRRYRRDLGVFDRVRPATEFLAAGEGGGVPCGPGMGSGLSRFAHRLERRPDPRGSPDRSDLRRQLVPESVLPRADELHPRSPGRALGRLCGRYLRRTCGLRLLKKATNCCGESGNVPSRMRS